MKKFFSSTTLMTGLAMFSMFFGAGNVIFPLVVGQMSQSLFPYAILGLLITAVGFPFLGLISMTLYDGNTEAFFSRIGKIPGLILALIILSLIGPLGGMPRVLTLSHSTSQMFIPWIPQLAIFSLFACLVIYGFTYKPSRILELLGKFLTPLLLLSLAILIIQGLITSPPIETSMLSPRQVFSDALVEGYNTMDLMGAFFFSSVSILCLKNEFPPHEYSDFRKLIKITLKASVIGAFLLAIVYIGFATISAYHSKDLIGVSGDYLIGTLALKVLGPHGGIIANSAVSLACLTTAIALAAIFAEFLHEQIFLEKLSYNTCLILTIIGSYFMSLLKFQGVMFFLVSVLKYFYPALIVLCLCNIAEKLWGFKPVKTPFWGTLLLTVAYYLL
jgi:LIVCS family branched-chain amino acid:cation transporter